MQIDLQNMILDTCSKAGGGTVRFPAGEYYSKPLRVRTKTIVQLDEGATLLASTNHADWMKVPGDWFSSNQYSLSRRTVLINWG